jgi:dolichol-phosphate mannosyltransferase
MEESAGAQDAPGATGRVVIVMPTYNERQNLEIITGRVRESVPDADLLVVDDNSPDGTGDLADKLAETDRHVQVMHRTEKAGLGRAYVAGFSWALEHGYDVIVEMDADGSHRPEDLPRLLAALDSADAVIGSRYVPGGTVVNWPKSREFLSRGANIYNRVLLGISIKDATGGFRVYRASTLRRLDLNNIESAGYCFQIDMTLRVLQAGLKLTEVPIMFVERERGASKMSSAVIREAFFRVAQWGITARLHGRSAAAPRRKLSPPGGRLRTPRYPLDQALRRSARLAASAIARLSMARRSLMTSRRSARTASRSSTLRRSISMSQWLRGGLAFFGSADSPVLAVAMAPQTRHSHMGGSSASAAKGTLKWCPFGQSKGTSWRGARSVLRSFS